MEVLSLVNYYARLGYYRHVQTVCAEVLKKRANDPLVSLWKAFGMIKEGAAGEAVRELEAMLRRADPQMQLPLKIALMHAHRACKVVDTETLTRLETELMGSTEDTSVPDRARMTAAQLLWHFGETFDAKQHVQHILRMQKSNVPALVLSGWLELADAEKELSGVKFSSEACNGDPSEEFEAAESFFEQAIQAGGGAKDLDAMMGIAKLASMQGNHRGALDKLSEVIGLYAWFLPALAEKALVLLNLGDWEQAVETAQRVLAQSDNQGGRGAGAGTRSTLFSASAQSMPCAACMCSPRRHPLPTGTLDALRVCALHAISQETDARAAASRLTELSQALDRHEPLNARLYIDVARPFARLAGRNPALLSLTLALTNTACRIAPDKAEYAAENAYQLMLLEDHQGAMQVLKRASSLEEGADEVMPFLIKSQILAGEILDAEMQLEFVKELQAAPAPEMSFNMALVASRRYKDVDTAVGHLDRASTQQLAKARKLPLGSAFYTSLNPDFLLEIAREYLKHCGEADGSALDEGSRAAQLLGKATRVLHEVAKHSPGLLDSQMQLARAHYLRADYEAALRCCSSIAKADPTFADAALLHAQILLKLDKTRQAGAVLDSALSHNFAVREQPLFQLIKAQILHLQGEFAEAETMLSRAIAAQGGAGARAGAQNQKSAGGRQRGAAMPPPPTTLPEELKLNLSDKCSLHMQLVDALLAQQKVSEAQSAMAAAVVEFDGTPVEGRLQIANAKVQVVKGDIESALQLLRAIPSESAHYHAARKALADLYLEHRNDKRAYAACHEEVAAANPTVASYMMLGEAYMAVLEPEKAIAAFETALRKSPNDPVLASRIGHVLVSTHAYAKAIEYYSDAAAADPSKTPLRYELAALYLNLKRYDAAMTELKQLIAACGYSAGAVPDGGGRARMVIEDALLVTKALQLQAKVHKALNALPEALEALHQAQSNQQNALAQLRAETGGADQLATQQVR
jgi:tetratricopeptide repeat protein 21B